MQSRQDDQKSGDIAPFIDVGNWKLGGIAVQLTAGMSLVPQDFLVMMEAKHMRGVQCGAPVAPSRGHEIGGRLCQSSLTRKKRCMYWHIIPRVRSMTM